VLILASGSKLIRPRLRHKLKTLPTIDCQQHLMALVAQEVTQHLLDHELIIDDEDLCHGLGPLWARIRVVASG
jgi:hypothetical protein